MKICQQKFVAHLMDPACSGIFATSGSLAHRCPSPSLIDRMQFTVHLKWPNFPVSRALPGAANVHGRLRGELLHRQPRVHDRGPPPRSHVLLRDGQVQRRRQEECGPHWRRGCRLRCDHHELLERFIKKVLVHSRRWLISVEVN